MIINAIPANALQQTIEVDIRTLPYFGQWSAISIDEEDRVVVWKELDMTSAFHVFRLESAWYKFQTLVKPVSGQFASRWVPKLWAEESVHPVVTIMAMGWKSSCGLLQQIHRKLCFLPKPWEQGWTHPERFGAMFLFLEAAGHMIQASTACTWMDSAMPNSSIGISSVETIHETWYRLGVPSQQSSTN